jgi:hypothetical protein
VAKIRRQSTDHTRRPAIPPTFFEFTTYTDAGGGSHVLSNDPVKAAGDIAEIERRDQLAVRHYAGGQCRAEQRRKQAAENLRSVQAIRQSKSLSWNAAARLHLQATDPEWLMLTDSERDNKTRSLVRRMREQD